ncbi:MAG: tRNA1(Val) (adenine(37)-N6)-methyltransferase [Coprococcus sp.]
MMINLKPNERIDDLQCKGYRIIQNKEMFCFGMDAVLLANFVKQKTGNRCIDLGTGTGVIPILMAAKEPEPKQALEGQAVLMGCTEPHFIGLEIQEACAEMAARSISLNDLSDRVRIDCGDIKEVPCNYKKASFDIVTSNPPYIRGSHGLENPDEPKNIARHEILVSLEEVVASAAYLLRPGGSFYMVHKPFRLAEIFDCLMRNKLEPKRMQLVYPYVDKEPNMVIIEGVKGGNSMIKIEPPMIVYESPGVYTRQLLSTYEGEAKTDR